MSNWKDRLRAFDDLAPDEAVYTRAAQGSRHGDVPDEPSGRKRLVAGIVAFAVFGVAAVFGWQAFQRPTDQPASPSTTAVVISLMGTEAEPTATVNYGDSWQAGVFEKYTWCSAPDDCTTVETDLAYPPIREGVEVPVGAPIRFTGDAQVERAVIRTTEGDQASQNVIADTDGTAVSVPDVPGDYLIWVAADWERGSGAFYVRIRAAAEPTDSGAVADVLAIDCTEEGTVVAVPFVRAQDDGVHFEVANQSGVDEVLIAPAGSGDDDWGADMDLSGGLSHVFDFAPGDLMVGCFSEENMPGGQVKDWSELPGMVPVTIAEPPGGYVSSELSCSSDARKSITAFGNTEPFPTPEDAVRTLLIGVEDSDLIERVGYPTQRAPGEPDGGVGLRIVRDGQVVAYVVVATDVGATPFVRADACDASGIMAAPPLGGGSPTP